MHKTIQNSLFLTFGGEFEASVILASRERVYRPVLISIYLFVHSQQVFVCLLLGLRITLVLNLCYYSKCELGGGKN